jgi:hypothetical protein
VQPVYLVAPYIADSAQVCTEAIANSIITHARLAHNVHLVPLKKRIKTRQPYFLALGSPADIPATIDTLNEAAARLNVSISIKSRTTPSAQTVLKIEIQP